MAGLIEHKKKKKCKEENAECRMEKTSAPQQINFSTMLRHNH
ncbi:hypothetical protein J002_05285 [Cryptococcus neoformans]|nr:hypothetical protein J002_05285 [Cryptococcus neoformans var. grubii]